MTWDNALISAILAASVALMGVGLTNRHQRKLAEKEREYRLKVDVYLRSAAQFSRLKTSFSQVSNLDIDLNAFSEDADAIAQLTLIAKDKTVQCVNDLMTQTACKFMGLLPKRQLLREIKSEVDSNVTLLESYYTDYKNVLARLENGASGADVSRLNGRLNLFEEEITRLHERQRELGKASLGYTRELYQEAMDELFSLTPFEVAAIKSIRDELRLGFDEQSYLQQIEASNRELKRESEEQMRRVNWSNGSGHFN